MANDSEAQVGENGPQAEDPRVKACIERYWRRNVRLMTALLFIWATVSLGCGVLFVEALNAYHLGGFPLGFWFAQQGSILVFVVLVFIYALEMKRLDRAHHVELAELARSGSDATR
jgi:putative solute:sodium symporter small subunit